MESTVAVCRSQPCLVGRPEPSVDVLGEEIWSVTTIKVTQTARGPEVGNINIDEPLDPLVLLPGLEGHQIHAPLPAVVPGVEPVPLGVPHAVVVVLPAEPVQVTIESLNTPLVNSFFAKFPIWEAEFPRPLILVSTTIIGKELVPPRGLWGLGPIVYKLGTSSKKPHHRLEKIL